MSNEIFEFLDILFLILTILGIPYFLFLRPPTRERSRINHGLKN